MTAPLLPLVGATSSTGGTGAASISGTIRGHLSIATAAAAMGVSSPAQIYYVRQNADATKWAFCQGTWTAGSPDTLDCDTTYLSSTGSAISWTAGEETTIISWVAPSRIGHLQIGQAWAADTIGYATDTTGALSTTGFTAAGRALVDDADATAQRATLGVVIGTDVQAYDADLSAIAALISAADRLPYATGAQTWDLATFTAAGRALLDDADAAAQRTTLGLGTAATQATGTSGTVVPLLDGNNTYSGSATFTGTTTLSGTSPDLRWRETDQSLPAGLWRVQVAGNEMLIQRNTAVAGDFSTTALHMWFPSSGTSVVCPGGIVGPSSTTVVTAAAHLKLRSYTVATLPTATAQEMIYVSDGTGNKRQAVADGTNWRFPDGNIVS